MFSSKRSSCTAVIISSSAQRYEEQIQVLRVCVVFRVFTENQTEADLIVFCNVYLSLLYLYF